jgi:glycosyltransferase involved in cell wall biosynthesis
MNGPATTGGPRIAFLHFLDARNPRTWSGALNFTKTALERNVGAVDDLSPVPLNLLPFRIARRLVRRLTGREYSFEHDPGLARYIGRYFSRRVSPEKHDLVFAPAGSSSLAFLKTDLPVVYYSDATWRLIEGYYPNFSNVVKRTARGAEELERRTLERADLALFASDWAAASAVEHYGADPAQVRTVYIGAVLPDPPRREDVLPRRLGDKIRLLLVGVSWEIKGGDTALSALEHLLEMGYDAELTVVGCSPPPGVSHPRLEVVPFLDKTTDEGRERFRRIWLEADFFILPSRCECAGMVLCEAAANALPAIAARTGGIPSLVREGRNGHCVDPEKGGLGYAHQIAQLVGDPAGYAALCESSREEFEDRLSWDAWGRRVAEAVAERFPTLESRLPASSSNDAAAS